MRPASCLGLAALALLLLACTPTDEPVSDPAVPAATAQELEQIAGIKEAMIVGTGRAVDRLGREDGYFADLDLRIPLPDDIRQVDQLLRSINLGHLVDDLHLAMNRAAERSAAEAGAIFVPAARDMLVLGAPQLVAGGGDTITRYFRQRTANQVDTAYHAVVQRHLEAEPGYRHWRRDIMELRSQHPLFTSEKAIPVPV